MQPADQQHLREKYRFMTDEALAELHLEGPEAYADPDGWRVLDEEYCSRGSRAEDARESVLAEIARRDGIAAAVVPLYVRLGAAVVDIGVCLLILGPFIVIGVEVNGLTVPVIGLLLATFVYLPLAELKWHATLGKRLCGLAVACEDSGPIAVSNVAARALARFVAWGILIRPSVLFHLHEPAVLLDDLFSKTRVIRRLPADAPPN